MTGRRRGAVRVAGASIPEGDQRALGRTSFQRRVGFSPGGVSLQDDELEAYLRYVADLSRTGTADRPRTRGFANIQRAR